MKMTDGYYDKVSRALRNGKIRILSPGEEAEYDTVISLEEDMGKSLQESCILSDQFYSYPE